LLFLRRFGGDRSKRGQNDRKGEHSLPEPAFHLRPPFLRFAWDAIGLVAARGRYETALKSSKFRLKCFQIQKRGGGGGLEAPFSTHILLFEQFRLDRHGLFRRDEGAAPVPVEIGSRALDVLGVLLGRPGDLVTRDEIVAAVWPTTVVEDNNLNMQIAALRRVLDRDRAQGSCIQTVPGRGYRFLAPVTRVEPATPPVSNGSGRSIAGNGQPLDPDALGQIRGMPHITTSRTRHGFRGVVIATVIGAFVLVVAVAVGIWHSTWFGDAHPAPRLSIVVLPFANLGNDTEQQCFVDGVTEDLTIDLSRIAHMLVISRNTAFTYRNKQVDTK
jgi:DNA-binding winged helix-turn-helix (wHTH) protein